MGVWTVAFPHKGWRQDCSSPKCNGDGHENVQREIEDARLLDISYLMELKVL